MLFYAHFYGRRYRPWLTELWVLLSRSAEIQKITNDIKLRKRSDKKYTAAVEGRGQVIKT